MARPEATRREGVLRWRRERTRWLSSGWRGGYEAAPAAYNLTVPEGWAERDLDGYLRERLARAGFEADGPALLTGVDVADARGARRGPVTAVATAGLSNPAELPVDVGEPGDANRERSANAAVDGRSGDERPESDGPGDAAPDRRPGTVNLLVYSARALTDGALASLLALVAEAKAATLLAAAGVPGTTSDAAVVGCPRTGPPAAFAGSATEVGACARACVREAVRAALAARYPDGDWPRGIEAAESGVRTDRRAEVFEP